MDNTTHARSGVEILPWVLWLLLLTSPGIPLCQYERPRQNLRTGSGAYNKPYLYDITDTQLAVVLDRRALGFPPHRNPLRHRLVRPPFPSNPHPCC